MRRGSVGRLDLVLVLALGVALGLAAAALLDRLDSKVKRVYVAQTATVHTEPRVLTDADMPFVLQHLDYLAHGGVTRIEWFDGAWAPRTRDAGSYVSLFVDDERVTSALMGGRSGDNSSRPGSLVWVGSLAAGTRDVEIRVERAEDQWAIPEASTAHPVQDLLLILEWA
jgi:hypothetical protein